MKQLSFINFKRPRVLLWTDGGSNPGPSDCQVSALVGKSTQFKDFLVSVKVGGDKCGERLSPFLCSPRIKRNNPNILFFTQFLSVQNEHGGVRLKGRVKNMIQYLAIYLFELSHD